MTFYFQIRKRLEKLIHHRWEKLLLNEPSIVRKFLTCFLIFAISITVTRLIYFYMTIYVPSITIISVILTALYGGVWFGTLFTLLLSLTNDYFFMPQIGSILTDRNSIDHLIINFMVSAVLAIIVSSLRQAYKGLTIAKLVAERAKQDSELAKLEAERANKNKSSFLATISHEIRTPLNGIIGLSDVLRNMSLRTEEIKLVELIHSSGQTLLKIINDILDYSKIESGKIDLENSDFSIYDSVEQVILTLNPKASKKGIHLDFEVDENIPKFVNGDASRISQILFNLTGNAIKFTSTGSVVLKVKLEESRENKARIYFSITDTGSGISKEQQERLFHPFTQLQKIGTSGEAGTGLGLSICRQLLRVMNSEIYVESIKDSGSRFYFTLNFSKFSIEKLGSQINFKKIIPIVRHTAIKPIFMDGKKPLILVVEDNPTNQVTAQALLEQLGAQVILASNGYEALDLISKTKVDLIFMDCQMPVMDGFEATVRIRKTPSKIPIIAMTANASNEDSRACKDVGMDSFITKPITIAMLKKELLKWLYTDQPNSLDDTKEDFNTRFVELENTIGKENVFKIIRTFISTLPDFQKSFEELQSQDDLVGLQHLGHRFKGSALTVGATIFATLCGKLEAAENITQAIQIGLELISEVPILESNLIQIMQSNQSNTQKFPLELLLLQKQKEEG